MSEQQQLEQPPSALSMQAPPVESSSSMSMQQTLPVSDKEVTNLEKPKTPPADNTMIPTKTEKEEMPQA